MKKLLNVGGNSKSVPLPARYAGYEHLLLDIDPKCSPDILCDARELLSFPAAQFDVIFCNHNLEHYYRHEVAKVLQGFVHVLKDDGFADICVPDVTEVMRVANEKGLDMEDAIYELCAGPVKVLDVLYGYSSEIEKSGQDFYSHKTGFSVKSLMLAMQKAGFAPIYAAANKQVFEILALGFKRDPSPEARAMFGFPAAEGSEKTI